LGEGMRKPIVEEISRINFWDFWATSKSVLFKVKLSASGEIPPTCRQAGLARIMILKKLAVRFPLGNEVEKTYRREKTFLIAKDSQAIGVGILIKEKVWLAVRFPLPIMILEKLAVRFLLAIVKLVMIFPLLRYPAIIMNNSSY